MMNTTLESARLLVSSPTHYAARLARNLDDVRAAQALRYQVFNLELNEGLEQSHVAGLDEDPFEAVCDHLDVLGLLWKGTADYARQHEARYLFGCTSVTSQDPAVGASAYADLCRQHLVEPQWRSRPLPAYDCSLGQLAAEPVTIPELLRAYLTVGAKICGPPALDRQFKTIDFLTLLDLETLHPLARQRFLGA